MNKKEKLSLLWLFATLNYLYCDIVTVMDSGKLKQFLSGVVNGIQINQGFLLASSLLVEIPIVMIVLSRILNYRKNRIANITAGVVMTLVQVATIFGPQPTNYYLFFSLIEISTTVFIIIYALKWSGTQDNKVS